ncbi:MAG: chromate transporter [Mycoplasmatales bacterium]|nr:chromate transporter [Mycoplasmatales bacterium]
MVLLIACAGVLVLGLIVFGGGQVFMPLFKSLWEFMSSHGANIDADKIDNMFSIANSTPGVVSTKLATFTGYLAANGEWWGWLALILTYLIFSIPSIILVKIAYNWVSKSETSKYLKGMMLYLRPVIGGILLSLAIQLLIATAFPSVVFNESGNFVGSKVTERSSFFSGWRKPVLISYVIIVIPESFFLYKKGVNLFNLIIIHMILGLILFEPWL